MGKKVIEDAELGMGREAFLEGNERLQTDAEWHGSILEDILFREDSSNDTLLEINSNLEKIVSHLESNQHRLPNITNISENKPMRTWRFIFVWIMALVISGILAIAVVS